MKQRYHEGIFYTSDQSLVKAEEKKEPAKALIVPHQELSRCASLLREAFAHAGDPKRVIILAPIHNGRLGSDKDYAYFEGELLPSSRMISLGCKVSEWYAEEEPAAEMLVPFLEANLPEASWSVVYCDIKTAKDAKSLSSFIKSQATPDTLFIISTNLSGDERTIEDMEKYREAALDALKSGTYLLDKMNRNQIHMCGGGIVDALERVLPGGWIRIGVNEHDTMTAHAALYKEL